MSAPLLWSLGLCVIAVGLEALCAGGGIRQRLAELRTPRFVPPLWGWIVIGGFYYVMCFAILFRLFSLASDVPLRNAALALVVGLMLINAFWNYFFFRARNLFYTFLIGVPYAFVALALFCFLLRLDSRGALWLAPYLLYLCYASAWGYRIWKLNRRDLDR